MRYVSFVIVHYAVATRLMRSGSSKWFASRIEKKEKEKEKNIILLTYFYTSCGFNTRRNTYNERMGKLFFLMYAKHNFQVGV